MLRSLIDGLITLAIVATAAASFSQINSQSPNAGCAHTGDLARQLEPLLGSPAARWFFGAGLFAAGLTSAITAPLAAAFATTGALGLPLDLKSRNFRLVWITVLSMGALLRRLRR